MIKILIADDHPLVREGLSKILKEEIDMEVVCKVSNGYDILKQIDNHTLDIIVMDISMPGISGIDVLNEIRAKSIKIPVLILSMHPEERYAIRVLKCGAAGYITKESAPEELIRAIRKIISGGKYITPTIAEKLAIEIELDKSKSPHEKLSDREFQVFCRIASGKSPQQIAEELCLSLTTISTYRVRILEKMDMKTNAELTHYAFQNHLID